METNIINIILNETFAKVVSDDDRLVFVREDGSYVAFYHRQVCCENVYIESIVGDLSDLVGSPILMAEEVISDSEYDESGDPCTWTFYKFATIKGYVDVRWLGTSNGYYSESVDMYESLNDPTYSITTYHKTKIEALIANNS